MRILDDTALNNALDWNRLIDTLADALRHNDIISPDRHVHKITLENGKEASLLLMPVWKPGEGIVVKAVTYFPDNSSKDLPTIHATAIRFDGTNGTVDAICDADVLTARRTAAGSALAARYLVRKNAHILLIVGTGQLSTDVAMAHCFVHHYERVMIYGRNQDKATKITKSLIAHNIKAETVKDLEAAIRIADTISCVTSATRPIIHGEWLKAGAHLDLIGSFRPDMRESDNSAIASGRLFVDTLAGAMRSGDLAQPIESGIITKEAIIGELGQLIRGEIRGRQSLDEITIFKSAGFAVEDYVAMQLAAN